MFEGDAWIQVQECGTNVPDKIRICMVLPMPLQMVQRAEIVMERFKTFRPSFPTYRGIVSLCVVNHIGRLLDEGEGKPLPTGIWSRQVLVHVAS